MTQLSQLFVEAGTLLLAGMIFVFAFLGILVVVINKVIAPLAELFPDPVPARAASSQSSQARSARPDGVSPQIVAAISAAIAQYRQKNSK